MRLLGGPQWTQLPVVEGTEVNSGDVREHCKVALFAWSTGRLEKMSCGKVSECQEEKLGVHLLGKGEPRESLGKGG